MYTCNLCFIYIDVFRRTLKDTTLALWHLPLRKILSRGHLLFLGRACSILLIDVTIQIQDRRKYSVGVLSVADISDRIDPAHFLHLQCSPCRTCNTRATCIRTCTLRWEAEGCGGVWHVSDVDT